MPAVVNCPKCDAQVSLPVGANPVWRVRCPLCEEEFPLAEALDQAPPALIVVDRAGATQTDTPPWPANQGATADDVAALHDFEIELDDSPSEAPPAGATATPAAASDGPVPLDVGSDYGGGNGLSNHGMSRPVRSGHHWVGRVVGVVGGGVVGLMLGYLALLWLGGPSRDFLKLGAKLPAFVLPAEFDRSVAMAPPLRRDQTGSTSSPPGKADRQRTPPAASQPEPTQPPLPTARSEGPSQVDQGTSGSYDAQFSHAPPAPRQGSPAELPPLDAHDAAPVRPAPWVVSQGPAYSVSAVDRALKVARSACDVLANSSLTDRDAIPAMGKAYRDLCDLAEAITNPEPGIDPVRILRRRRIAGDMVRQLAEQRAKRHDLARIADHWIDAPQRTKQGIVLAGPVEDIYHIDSANLYALRIALTDKRTVTVLSAQRPSLGVGDLAVVLGSIVDRPTAALTTLYDGDQVIVRAGVIRRVLDGTSSEPPGGAA